MLCIRSRAQSVEPQGSGFCSLASMGVSENQGYLILGSL